MDLYFLIISIILLWVCGCRCIPRPQHTSTTTSPATMMAPRSLQRSNAGWSTNIYTTNRTEGGSGTRVVFPNHSGNDGPYQPPPRRHKPSSSPNRNKHQEIQPVDLEPCDNEDVKLCEAEHYPKKYLEDLLLKSGVQFRALFGTDFFESEEESKDGTLITRIDGLGESPLCQSTQELIRPTKGEDVSGVTRFIINQDNFTQGIRIEKCVEVGSACQFADIFPNGYIATCKQKYIHRKLAALNDNNEVEWMFFPIPSCCMCMYRSSRRAGRSLSMSKVIKRSKRKTLSYWHEN